MGKRDLILDTMQHLLTEKKGAACSVSDIAKHVGIAKGGMYYYFKSKEDVFDALVERTYEGIINCCKEIPLMNGKNALEKLELLYLRYRGSIVSSELDAYLHLSQNAEIHQKSLAKILTGLSPVIAQIIEQGAANGEMQCSYPLEMSEMIMSVFCFLFDSGIFPWTAQQAVLKLKALAMLLEKGLDVKRGSMDFLLLPLKNAM